MGDPLVENILREEPRAPEYARLSVDLCCNGAGWAKGARLSSIVGDALATVKRLEVDRAELAERLERAEAVLRNISHTDSASHARVVARLYLDAIPVGLEEG